MIISQQVERIFLRVVFHLFIYSRYGVNNEFLYCQNREILKESLQKSDM